EESTAGRQERSYPGMATTTTTPLPGAVAAAGARDPASDALRARLLSPWPRVGLPFILILGCVAGAYAWGINGTKAEPAELVKGLPNILTFLRRLAPPVWETQAVPLRLPAVPLPFGLHIPAAGPAAAPVVQVPVILFAILETTQMALIGT